MSLPSSIPAAVLETVLIRLAALFIAGANGDMAAAHDAAHHTLTAYHPETETELRIAANIISFGFQCLEALAQAAAADMPLTRVLRLRGSAVTLSRESSKAERRLSELQTARRQGVQAETPQAAVQPAETQPTTPQPEPLQPTRRLENAVALVQDTAAITETAKASNQTWTKAQEDHQRELRIAASIQRAEAKIAAHAALQSAMQAVTGNTPRMIQTL